jgi:2'-5' RNA ligase
MGGVPHARWQDDDQLHLTLRFIGAVERPVANDIAGALGQIRAAAPAVALHGVGAFDKLGRANAIWAGVAPHDTLARLHRKVDHALIAIGLAPEHRAYLPHITLARLPRSAGAAPEVARFIADHGGLTSAPFALTHMTLFESRLGSTGARYDSIARWPLDR